MHTVYTTSRGIASAPELPTLLNGATVKLRSIYARPSRNTAVVGWGKKANTNKAQAFAAKHNLPYWRLEDGFISYLGHPALGDKRFSLIVDKTGMYYDATQPSDIENLLNHPLWQAPDQQTQEHLSRSRALLATITRYHISKYNHEPVNNWQPATDSQRVLVVDQTYGDCSVAYGLANHTSFTAMLEAALEENPACEVWIKVHPDVVLGTKQGYFDLEPCGTRVKGFHNNRLRILADKTNAQSLFPHFEKVYVVTSQLGFEALWHQKSVVCFGAPFYSGWGLTDDRVTVERRQQQHTIESLFAAACLQYTRYIHPETGQRCELEEILELIALQKTYAHPQVSTLYALGFSLWKRAFISTFARDLADRVVYVRNEKQLHKRLTSKDGVLVWGMNNLQQQLPSSVLLWRMEDGFIRSCGLGAELRRPGSLVLDSRGIYYNATQTSDLEHALNTLELSEAQRKRGADLIDLLLQQRISKYNLSGESADIFADAQPGQRKVLVTGQVDSDASLKFGSPEVYTNHDLLAAVSASLKHDNAYIIYKPHPDVVQAGRAGHVPEEDVLRFADKIVTDVDIFDCLQQCDELHAMSSQAGFEALLQRKIVHCWGMPFYAGWGLTTDAMACPRRTQKRTVAELAYIALCYYPRYIHWGTRRFTTPENLIHQINCERQNNNTQKKSSGAGRLYNWLGRKKRKLAFLLEALRTR